MRLTRGSSVGSVSLSVGVVFSVANAVIVVVVILEVVIMAPCFRSKNARVRAAIAVIARSLAGCDPNVTSQRLLKGQIITCRIFVCPHPVKAVDFPPSPFALLRYFLARATRVPLCIHERLELACCASVGAYETVRNITESK